MQLDTGEYIAVLRELVEEGREVSVRIAGNSMMPFLIHNRDTVYFSRPKDALKVGDIVFYQRSDGSFILHRICRIRGREIYTVGDAQQRIEGPLKEEQIFARVTGALRKGKRIGPGNFWWEFFRCVWIRMIPLRHFVMKLYGIRFGPGEGGRHG